ncbi:MAG: SRPBCC family protein [Dehalococcoidia bacterium]
MKTTSLDTTGGDPRELAISRVIGAPREAVFDALTNAGQISAWWGPRGFAITTAEIDIRPGGRWRFTMHGPDGTDYRDLIIYSEITRPSRIAFQHYDDSPGAGAGFETTISLEEVPEGTRVTLLNRLATPEERDAAIAFGAVEGGLGTLERLEEHLLLRPEEGVTFQIARVFHYPVETIFRAWTECEHLRRWWGPPGFEMSVCNLDLRPGGTWHYCLRSESGEEMWAKWTYRDVVRQRRLTAVNSFSDANGNATHHPMSPDWPLETLGTMTFEAVPEGTRVTLVTVPWDTNEAGLETFRAGIESMEAGFGATFDKLDAYLGQTP